VADDTWIYPAPAWESGDRVAIDSEGHAWHDELGTVTGPADWDDEGAWEVQLDDGTTVSAYTHELTGVSTPSSVPQEGEKP
jgi:hypothetical protein